MYDSCIIFLQHPLGIRLIFCFFSIDLAGGHHVDLDLVAAISFEPSNFQTIPEIWKNLSGSQWLKGRDETHQKRLIEGMKKDGFLVPISEEKLGPEWSLHFPKAEKEILWNLGCVKPVIRYLKQFRDSHWQLEKLKVGQLSIFSWFAFVS